MIKVALIVISATMCCGNNPPNKGMWEPDAFAAVDNEFDSMAECRSVADNHNRLSRRYGYKNLLFWCVDEKDMNRAE